jgi:hypothetical protein
MVNELKATVIRPENLRIYFDKNPKFLPHRTNDWLVELYSLYENVGAAFAKNKNETNTLTCNIVKTTKDVFVAPYRKTENKQLIPNVFLFTEGIDDPDIHFVNVELYERCKDFFDNILQIQKPNEYEFFVKDIRRRYSENYVFDEEKHVEDFKKLLKYLKHEEYKSEIIKLIRENFLVRCDDGNMRSPYMTRIFLSVNAEGIEIQNYLKNIAKGVFFVDSEFYLSHGIGIDLLNIIGIRTSLLINENITSGQYDTGKSGRQPEWWTTGDFRWRLNVEYIKEALRYISKYPTARDSVSKSLTIFHLLLQNEDRLVGKLNIGGTTPNKERETCEFIKILRGERLWDWDGKWIYTSGGELVSPKMVSKHEISSKYCKSNTESIVFELLGFKKTERDELENFKKTIPAEKLEALIEYELKNRFGIGLRDIESISNNALGEVTIQEDNDDVYPFPIARVKNWDTLRKHAAEMLCYADPVKYDYAVRRIRFSNKPKEARAYLLNMYRYDGVYKYACQICHDSCASVEIAELFNKPETELDPLNLCLCPNCASKYRIYRNNARAMQTLLDSILELQERDMGGDYVAIPVEEDELWFTHIHFAEIQELLKLSAETKNVKKDSTEKVAPETEDKEGISVYESLVGKIVTRKDGFKGKIISVTGDRVNIEIITATRDSEKGKTEITYTLPYIVNPKFYTIN